MRKTLRLLTAALAVIFFSVITQSTFGQATVTSDKDDYAPRSTAVFTGAGFEPFETVVLKVKNLDRPCNTVSADSSYLAWSVTADGSGGFETNWTVCDCPGDSLRLKAFGETSGLIAYAYFTDANTNLSNPTPSTAVYGSMLTISSTLTQQGASGSCATCVGPGNGISGRTVSFSLSNGAIALGTVSTNSAGTATVIVPVNFPVQNYNGSNGLRASFGGDATPYSSSSNTVNFSVTKAVTSLSLISGSGIYGESVTLTATCNLNIANIPVNFSLDNIAVGSGNTNSSGVASITVAFANIPATVKNAGTHTAEVGASIANTTNYSAGSGTGNLVISKKLLTITATPSQEKVYGNNDPASLAYTFSPAGLAGTDAFSGNLTRVSGENVGTYAIGIGALIIKNGSTTVTTNYDITFTAATFGITPLNVAVSANTGQTKTYGAVNPSYAFTSSPAVGALLANGEVINFDGALERVTGENAGDYAINQGTLDNANYTINYTSNNFSITPLSVSVTANAGQTKVYGAVNPSYAFTSSPAVGASLANGEVINFDGALERVAGENVGNYAINQGTIDNLNYSIDYTSNNFSITPLTVSVTANTGQTKIYGSVNPSYAFTSLPAVGASLANGEVISFDGGLERVTGENVGDYAINQGTLDNANYTINYTSSNFSITPLTVAVTANTGQTKVYGSVNPSYAFTSLPAAGASLANGEVINFDGALERVNGENVGNYAINQGTLDNTNYAINYTSSNFSITPLTVSVTANTGQTKIYGAINPYYGFTSSPAVGASLANGDIINFDGALERVAGENVGNYAINQGTLDNANYTINYTGNNFSITPLTVSVTANTGQTKVYGDVNPLAYTYTSSPVVGSALANGDLINFTGELQRTAGENAGDYAINQGTLSNANYTINYTSKNFSISSLSVSVTANGGQTKVYGDVNPLAYTYTSLPAAGSALANGNLIDFTGALQRVAGENAGNYTINQGSLANTNYIITYTSNDFSITPLAVSVGANTGQTKIYGAANPLAYAFTSSPAANSALANGELITFTGALQRVAGENVGIYTISQGTLNNSNYTITYTGKTFSITTLSVSVTATPGQTKVYGAANPLSYAFTSVPAQGNVLANGDVVGFSGALQRIAGEDVGNYVINQGTLNNINYTITYTANNFAITKAQVNTSVTVSPDSKQYSDLVSFTATITGGAPLIPYGPQAAQYAVFKVGTQVMGQANFVVSGANLVATLSNIALIEGVAGQMSPGIKVVTAVINTANTNYALSNLAPTTNLTITQEDARVTYTGGLCVATSGAASTTATVTLSATIQDITALTGEATYDANAGDIRNARVKFINRVNNTYISSNWLTVGLVNAADTKTGTVVFNWTGAPIGQHTIGIVVDYGYYTRNSALDDQVINIYQPSGDFITGGGYLILNNSNGIKAGSPGSKNNFGFNVKYNKSGSTLQGSINTIIRRLESDNIVHTYQVKGNSMTSLSVKSSTTPGITSPSTATFNGKASIQDITNPLLPVPVDGNATLQVTISDAGEPGANDKIGIIVYNKSGGVWFSSNWNGSSTVLQTLAGGNLVARGGAVTASTTTTVASKSYVNNPEPLVETPSNGFSVKVLGNPSSTHFMVQVQSSSSEVIEINVFDMTGRHVRQYRCAVGESIRIGESLLRGTYHLQVFQGANKSTIKVIKH